MRYKTGNSLPRQDIQAAVVLAAMSFQPLAGEIFIPTPVGMDQGSMPVIPVSALMNDPGDIRRKPKSGSARSDWEMDSRSYACITYSHEEVVTQADARRVGNMFDAQKFAARRSRLIVTRKQEIRAKTLVHDTGTWTGATNTLGVGVAWATAATADPIGNFNTAAAKIRAKCGYSSISAQISYPSWRALSLCSQIRDVLKYTNDMPAVIPLNGLAKALGLKRIICPGDGNLVNSAREGQTETLAEIWTADKCFVWAEPDAADLEDAQMPCLGRMWTWDGDGGALEVDEYPEDQTESTVTRVKQCVQEDIVSLLFGFLLTGV